MASALGEAPLVVTDSTMGAIEPSEPTTEEKDAHHTTSISDTNPEEPPATFTSSLSIAVDGTGTTLANDKPENQDIVVSTPVTTTETPGKRMARKSKTDALAAINRSSSPSVETSKTGTMKTEKEKVPVPILNGTPHSISVSSSLDMSSVKTTAPRKFPPRKEPRLFGLEDCPVFYPSPEEFTDAMSYINSIAPKAQEYGIAKVVPPVGWKMPFVTDTETYRFKTRAMKLNSIEASSRVKINFLEALYRFHRQQGNPRIAVPTVNDKPLDLWLLRKEVQKLGGFKVVNQEKKWADVGRLMGYGGIPNLSTQLRNSYIRVILPYEHYSESVKSAATMSPSKKDTKTPTPHSSGLENGAHISPLSSPSMSTSSLSELPDEDDGHTKKHAAHDGSMSNGKSYNGDFRTPSPEVSTSKSICCEICHKRNRATEMLLCDGCDCGFHMFCLVPALTSIPKGQWYCHTCLFGTGGDYGFDDGEEHSLPSFQARDMQFRKMWFANHSPPQPEGPLPQEELDDPTVSLIGNIRVSESDVEKEFWRLVQSPYETVEIEYGADVHSTTHGSGMPTVETHPLDPYSRDCWNLNNMPILKESLLRYIKSEISGMTVPWTYVGMVFSTFCWHNEDHYTHSINYMHWGETKTWYGIPGADAEKFEAAIKKEAPDLFETQPDLLFQLVTLMSPATLREAGVRVYACDQRAGEFVITFPKAYHCGFNHGLNFNEAVNFALPDWLPLGQECVQRYQKHKKQPVFSHEELLITISQQSQSIATALWLNECFKDMVDREIQGREALRKLNAIEFFDDHDVPEEQYQCSICKAFCYLSQVKCTCSKKVNNFSCLEHSGKLCSCPPKNRVLRLRFLDSELIETQQAIAAKAAIPGNWRDKLNKLLSDDPKPPLRSLRALVAEADRIHYPLKEVAMLRRCVRRAQDWIEAANALTTRKQSRKRSKRARWQPALANGAGVSDEVSEKPEKSLDDVYALLKDVENLGFDSPEIGQLKTLAQQAEEFKEKASAVLGEIAETGDEASHLKECEALLAHGTSLNIYFEELFKIENIVLQHQLMKELEEVDDSRITLEQIRAFLGRANACYLPADNKYTRLLEEKLRAGTDWDQRATELLNQPLKTIDELNGFLVVESAIPVDPGVLNRIHAIRTKALEYERQAKEWLSPDSNSPKPTVQEALRLIQRSEKEFRIQAITDLKKTVDFAYDLEERCTAAIKGAYVHREDGSPIDSMREWKTYASEHLNKFRLPSLEALCDELGKHDNWLKKLPWYSHEDEQPHAEDVLSDVLNYTKPEDDFPPDFDKEHFTCICFEPVLPPPPGETSDAVQCEHCTARFHGKCADKRFSCPFCDPHQWNGDINSSRSYHFCYLPTVLRSAPSITRNYSEHWANLQTICTHVERLSAVIGRFLSYTSQPGRQTYDNIPQVRHFLRKLYKIGFAVSPNPEVSFGLDLAGLHRILALKPPSTRPRKRRKPKFRFGQDVDEDWKDGTRCICRGQTTYLGGYAIVSCLQCSRKYHEACVCFKGADEDRLHFTCPLCCIRSGKQFPYADIRVRSIEDKDPHVYIDVKACLDTYSKHLIRIKLNPPSSSTIFLDLVHFVPAQQEQQNRTEASGNQPHAVGKVRAGSSSGDHASHAQSYPAWMHGDPTGRQSSLVFNSPLQSGLAGASEGVLSLRKKRKHTDEGGDNIHVFEVDPHVNVGSPTTHQSVHKAHSNNLNIIVSHPEKMAVAHGGPSSRPRYTPPSATVPSVSHQGAAPARYYAEASMHAMYPQPMPAHYDPRPVPPPIPSRPSHGAYSGVLGSSRDVASPPMVHQRPMPTSPAYHAPSEASSASVLPYRSRSPPAPRQDLEQSANPPTGRKVKLFVRGDGSQQ